MISEPTAWEEWIRFVTTWRINHGMRDPAPDHIKARLPDLFPEFPHGIIRGTETGEYSWLKNEP